MLDSNNLPEVTINTTTNGVQPQTALSGETENDKEDKYSNEDNSRKNSFND